MIIHGFLHKVPLKAQNLSLMYFLFTLFLCSWDSFIQMYFELLYLCFSQVEVQNDFSDEMFTSEWHYAKDIVKRQRVTGTTTGYHNYDLHVTDDRTRVGGNPTVFSLYL